MERYESGKMKFSIKSRLIPILFFVSAIINALLGIFFILRPSSELSGFVSSIFGGYASISTRIDAFLFFALSVLLIIAGIGLWKKKKLAKVLAIIITSFGIFGAVIGIISPMITNWNIFTLLYGLLYNSLAGFQFNHWIYLLLNGFILIYLLFNKKIK